MQFYFKRVYTNLKDMFGVEAGGEETATLAQTGRGLLGRPDVDPGMKLHLEPTQSKPPTCQMTAPAPRVQAARLVSIF